MSEEETKECAESTTSLHSMKLYDLVQMAERGWDRAAEVDFMTLQLMLFNPVAESELRVERTFSTFSDAKDRIHEQLGITGKDGCPRE